MTKKNPDHIRKHIKDTLLPVAAEDGFQLYKPKVLVRVAGPFIDVISFQLSQYGSKRFYVHYHRNLIADPMMTIDSYDTGYRLSDNSKNEDLREWAGLEESQSKNALLSVVDAYEKTIHPWFESSGSIQGYVFAYLVKNNVKTINSLKMAIAFYVAGEKNRCFWICNDIVDEYEADPEGEDQHPEYLTYVKAYQESEEAESIQALLENENAQKYASKSGKKLPEVPDIEYKTVNSLVDSWRESNVKKYKLEKFVID